MSDRNAQVRTRSWEDRRDLNDIRCPVVKGRTRLWWALHVERDVLAPRADEVAAPRRNSWVLRGPVFASVAHDRVIGNADPVADRFEILVLNLYTE
jgi:hypothetical protein